MCDVCGKYICPPACPSFSGEDADSGALYARCAVCSDLIYNNDKSFRKSGMIFCEDCYDNFYNLRKNKQ